MIPLGIRTLQFTGHIYAVVLSIFRHTVHEDNGIISSLTDLVPVFLSLGFSLLPSTNKTTSATYYSTDVC